MMVADFICCWQNHYVGDSLRRICHQHLKLVINIVSPTFSTNIDVVLVSVKSIPNVSGTLLYPKTGDKLFPISVNIIALYKIVQNLEINKLYAHVAPEIQYTNNLKNSRI